MELPNKKYQIIYADPPWNFNFSKRNGLSKKAKDRLYNTMNDEDIINLPVNDLSDDNCVLFLWVMNSELPLALKCIDTWGFKYKTVAFTWVKKTKNTYHFGGGNWTRTNVELCLLSTKGKPKRINKTVRQLVISKLREHSRKPDEVRNRIIKLLGDLPRIELFARNRVDGWDCYGDQLSETIKKLL